MYLRPASCAASTAAATVIRSRTDARRMSIGRLTPAITSTRPGTISEIARFDGVPPNMSVSTMTPRPASARAIAAAMSARRASMSSSGPIGIASSAVCAPTTCSSAAANSVASRPCVTSTSPIITPKS